MIKTLILFLLMLSVIVTIHEAGHLIAAKIFGVYCHEFSIGMGPKLYSHKFKETEFCLRAFPIGGFVAMAGDSENAIETKVEVEVPKERTLPGISPIKRIIVMASGIFMNIVLALLIMSFTFLGAGKTTEYGDAIIQDVAIDSPAYKAEIQVGDKIIKASFENGYSISPDNYGELSNFLSLYDGKGNVTLKIDRNGTTKSIKVKPHFDDIEQRYIIGITFGDYKIVDVTLGNCFKYGFNYLWEMMGLIVMTLLGLFRGVGLDSLSGPVGVYQVTQEAISYGFVTYLSLIAMISINVGVFNALPLPIFDGGRILLTLIEMIMGRPLDKKVEQTIMSISTVLLLLLVGFTTFKDVFNLFR